MAYVLRTAGNPLNAVPAIRRTAAEVDPDMPVSNIETLEDTLGRSIEYPRYMSLLVGVFAMAAILLAAIGIYGVMAFGSRNGRAKLGSVWRLAVGVHRYSFWCSARQSRCSRSAWPSASLDR